MKKLVLAVLGAGFVSMIALAAVSEDDPVILKYVPADEAQKAIQKELGDRAGGAEARGCLRCPGVVREQMRG